MTTKLERMGEKNKKYIENEKKKLLPIPGTDPAIPGGNPYRKLGASKTPRKNVKHG